MSELILTLMVFVLFGILASGQIALANVTGRTLGDLGVRMDQVESDCEKMSDIEESLSAAIAGFSMDDAKRREKQVNILSSRLAQIESGIYVSLLQRILEEESQAAASAAAENAATKAIGLASAKLDKIRREHLKTLGAKEHLEGVEDE